MFFDERFNFVEEGSSYARTMQAGDGASPLVLANIKAPKNGYAYIYVSNENDDPVYFDNLQVAHDRGRIIEENHYYTFGLKIAGISSKKLGDANYEGYLDNKNLYNDKELIDEGDLNWYDYGFRNYDPQIGRFPQLDPLTDDYPHYTPYQYAGNEPIANVDLDGLEPLPMVTVTTYIPKAASQGASVGSIALRVSLTAANTGLRMGLDGVNTKISPPRTFNNTPAPSPSSYLSPAPYRGVYEEARVAQKVKQGNLAAGLKEDGSETFLGKLASNKTFTGAADNLVFPAITLSGLISGAGEAIQGIKMVGGIETANGAAFLEDVANLNPTHYLTRSKAQMQELISDIKVNGIKESIEYVEFNGKKYIVGGNHRYFAAQRLGIRQVPVKKVQLPFAGYKTPQDLMLEGKMPGYWKFLK